MLVDELLRKVVGQVFPSLEVVAEERCRKMRHTGLHLGVEYHHVVFTDERAPVETIIDSLVLRFLLQEGPAGLPGLGA